MKIELGARDRLAWALATSFGLGDRLPAPGTTAGSAPAAAAWLLFALVEPMPWGRVIGTAVASVGILLAGGWAAGVEARRRGVADPGPVVVDEVAGQWVCYLAALPFVELAARSTMVMFAAIGFFLFRLFDVVKPWPVFTLERLPGVVGIMADDVAAGLYAAAVLAVVFRFVP